MNTVVAAERFPAGEFLADELDERRWSQADFAEVLGRPAQFVSEIISGKKEITRESAAQIGTALGTSAEFWLNLQDSYFLWKQSQDAQTQHNLDEVRIRAQIRDLAPISHLVKRGFVRSKDPTDQAKEVLNLFGKSSFEDPSPTKFVARRSNNEESITVLQESWAACVRASAERLEVSTYSPKALRELAETLSARTKDPNAFAEFQKVFAEVGVKLVYVESFPGGKLDGCAQLVNGHPTIGLSGRGKRLDKVFFTLLHEVAHVLLGHVSDDSEVILDDLSSESDSIEDEADRLAAQLAISDPLQDVPERISADWVEAKSEDLAIHPILLIGRLQKESRLSWKSTLTRNAPTVIKQLEEWKAPRPQ
ncbi:MAG: HigA family addiction module antitoxin [Corynebacterium casei]|uniref:HigA family addiction module antitoxin n=1 Tax=Corynebacterium casei TaxID=160386 RepID=UPI00264733AA|nr:HigA family addiction module antitoxin [Corynebacterium casei]MDN5705937.1 HigA family addiction module antitoxin [Corynebacterium casei]MDN5827794.1 HigA family addiction module antitoxin [Corynebacterium casei]MDN6130621.1 HigA family addiction module antitoxin [Corynebacterium casei]